MISGWIGVDEEATIAMDAMIKRSEMFMHGLEPMAKGLLVVIL